MTCNVVEARLMYAGEEVGPATDKMRCVEIGSEREGAFAFARRGMVYDQTSSCRRNVISICLLEWMMHVTT